ncbi:hypothetical protein PsAD2_00958 [Pseudovibrio axinellae]|uniref:Uncharacterized protein n=1 Tax=Pseudovibrio axinellae TaxID=989403 RepID=A0A166AEJ2_9HYPH|nr:hypothetical protein [Pseudovibrio axinellae]KZL20966.1 hypothetical protein PsAD2_00958 [Pseudovibrio axinellae]SEP80998.1 hypothetical protein SAMN05421798_101443 [Pseudovibrio axinellae]
MGKREQTELKRAGSTCFEKIRGAPCAGQQFKPSCSFAASVLVVCSITLMLGACSRPTGDFGRVKPNILHDRIAQDMGILYRYSQKQDVSNLNQTDQEKELRGRGWALVVPPASEDWIGANKAQLQRQGFLKDPYAAIDISSYYVFLRSDKYRSSETRYARVIHDMKSDQKLLLPFCKIARQVLVSDHERLGALNRQVDVDPQFSMGVKARVKENKAFLDWVLSATGHRLQAYQIAINALEVETPSAEKIWDASKAYELLRRTYEDLPSKCFESVQRPVEIATTRSRIFTGWGFEEPVPQK